MLCQNMKKGRKYKFYLLWIHYRYIPLFRFRHFSRFSQRFFFLYYQFSTQKIKCGRNVIECLKEFISNMKEHTNFQVTYSKSKRAITPSKVVRPNCHNYMRFSIMVISKNPKFQGIPSWIIGCITLHCSKITRGMFSHYSVK
jgi:hypothetical protein